jgi:class 3 adenylate cyclase
MSNRLRTIVFGGLVKSTAIKSLLLGEDLEERNLAYLVTIEEPHHRRITDGLKVSGGRLVKNKGDIFLLMFDDPVKAARWSMSVQPSHREDPDRNAVGTARCEDRSARRGSAAQSALFRRLCRPRGRFRGAPVQWSISRASADFRAGVRLDPYCLVR